MRISYGAATRRATEISSSAPVDVSQTPLYAASQIAPRRDNLRWADQANLNLVTGPEACEGRSVPGIVPMLSSFEAVAKAVGDRSAGGMETSFGSLQRGPCDAVSEPSPTGRIGAYGPGDGLTESLPRGQDDQLSGRFPLSFRPFQSR